MLCLKPRQHVKKRSMRANYITKINEDSLEINDFTIDEIGDNHILTGLETPMKDDAFDLSDENKIEHIAFHFREIMETLGLDLKDDSLQGTPMRVAKMYVQEIFSGLDPKNIS